MNTDDLIRALAMEGEVSKAHRPTGWRVATAAALSLTVVIALVVPVLGVRADLADAVATPAGVAKFVLALALAAAACTALPRAVEPGRRARLDAVGILVGLALVAGALSVIAAPEAALAGSPIACVVSIVGLSILPFSALIAALRDGAPTRPEATGAVAGLASGGIAAFGFGLSCPMDLGPSVALWYPLAITTAGALGMLVSRRALGW